MDLSAKYHQFCSDFSPEEAKDKFVQLLKEELPQPLLLKSVDLSNCNLEGISFFKATLESCTFVRCTMTTVEFSGAQIETCDFSESQMNQAGFGGATILNSRFFNTSLHHVTFSQARISQCDFRCADFEESRFEDTTIGDSDFSGASMKRLIWVGLLLHKNLFNEVTFCGSLIRTIHGYESSQWIGTDIRDIHFSGAYELRRYIQDENYIDEFKNRSKRHYFYYMLWKLTSNCGRSLSRWLILIMLQIAFFTLMYTIVEVDYGRYESPISPLYYSIATMTTLGYGDVVPASGAAQIMASVQVVLGYIMLGGLLSILTNKLARRAD